MAQLKQCLGFLAGCSDGREERRLGWRWFRAVLFEAIRRRQSAAHSYIRRKLLAFHVAGLGARQFFQFLVIPLQKSDHLRIVRFARLLHQELHRSEEHTSELQSRQYLVCRLLLEKKSRTTPI